MLKHIVVFKLLEEAEGTSKAENAVMIKKMLDELPAKIPFIKGYEVGINIIESERAWDISLISTFDNKEDLNDYIVHPEHQRAGEFIVKRRKSSVSVDYEV
jgi:hypothetical protein